MPRPCRNLAIAKSAKFAADRLHADRETEFLPYPLRQVDQTPADHPMDGGDRPTLNHIRQRTPLRWAHQGRRSWRSAVDQPAGALRIESHHPIPHDLQANSAHPCGIATRPTFINRRQSQQTPGLIGIPRLASVAVQITGGKVHAKTQRRGHVEHPAVQQRESHLSPRRQAFVSLTPKDLVLHRKHAMRLLRARQPSRRSGPRPGRRLYNEAVREALIVIWEASDRVCGKRLRPLVPILVEAMERHGHLQLAPEVRAGLEAMGAATIDRALREVREPGGGRKRRNAPPSAAIRRNVPVRTFDGWDDPAPGFVEADLVAHSGPTAKGS